MTAIKNGTLLVKDSNGNTARVATLSQTDITTLNTALTDIEANKRKINSISANYVTTNTTQTISGKKTLTTTNKDEVVAVKVINTDDTVTPTEDLWTNVISVYDKNSKNVGNLQFIRQPDGGNWVGLQTVIQNANGNDIYNAIGVSLKADGTASTYAPNPASNSNDTSIATTSWVNTKVDSIGTHLGTSGLWLDTETMHNNIYRGADLLSAGHFSSINDIITAISKGDFSDIYVGDYIPASYTVDGEQKSTNFRIAGINYFKAATGKWGVHDNHVCIVPDTLGSSVMNDTNVTKGGYIGSKMYTTVLPKYYAALAGSAGTPFYGHIKLMKESFSNAVDTQVAAAGSMAGWKGATSGFADVADISLCLMSELEIYGCRTFSSAGDNFKNAAQLPMFRLNPNTITVWGTQNTWLRSVATSAFFCYADFRFRANCTNASYVHAVRPRFAIG